MSGRAAPECNQQTVSVGPFTVTADATVPLFTAKGTLIVESADAILAADVATHAADTAAITLINLDTDASGTTIVAGPYDTALAAITKGVPANLPVVAAAKSLTNGQVLALRWNEETTDVADATIVVSLRYTQVTAPAQA